MGSWVDEALLLPQEEVKAKLALVQGQLQHVFFQIINSFERFFVENQEIPDISKYSLFSSTIIFLFNINVFKKLQHFYK